MTSKVRERLGSFVSALAIIGAMVAVSVVPHLAVAQVAVDAQHEADAASGHVAAVAAAAAAAPQPPPPPDNITVHVAQQAAPQQHQPQPYTPPPATFTPGAGTELAAAVATQVIATVAAHAAQQAGSGNNIMATLISQLPHLFALFLVWAGVRRPTAIA